MTEKLIKSVYFFGYFAFMTTGNENNPRSVLPELSAKGLHKHESVCLKASLNQIINYYTYSANIFVETGSK